mmetsp:Transcript_36212/g.78122  ORF Transcript_36212/g.78122 Transcript_36212/m.78122 type:complete len:254 (-) Transcript_36212:2911-3672(-)
MLHLFRPAFRQPAARCFVELLPSQELLDVGLGVVLVFLIPRLDEVQVVNCLGANGAMAASNHNDLCCTVLQGGSHILDRKGAHASDHHSLATPVDACQGIGGAISHYSHEAFLPGNAQRSGQPNAIVDAQHHAPALHDPGTSHQLIIEKYSVVASFTQDLLHLDRSENVLFEAITKLGQILQHFGSRAVVPVVPSLAIFLPKQILDAVATFRAVDLRGAVGIHGPDPSHHRTLLQHGHTEPCGSAPVGGEHPQ